MSDLDPEMLENLDLLLDMDIVDAQEDWETLADNLNSNEEAKNE